MQNNLVKQLKSKEANSAYIHIPFCRRKCNYCAFTSFNALNLINDYIKNLVKEIKHFYKGTPLETLYIGGGTPSLLNIKHFEKILSLFNFAPGAEITVEVNPESADLNLLSNLYNLNVNRLSVGVQSFDDNVLKLAGRLHSANDAVNCVYLAKDIGFENVSIDLIYGLPTPDLKRNMPLWEDTLNMAKRLNVQHISMYGLKIEDGTPFSKTRPKHLPDDDIQADMYEFGIRYLAPEYELYEISNFATEKKFQSRHNLKYWNRGEYYGFGISAAGFLNEIRYQNTKNFMEYMKDPLTTKVLTPINPAEALEEAIFLGLRKREGINIDEINEKFNIDFDTKFSSVLEKFSSTGHLQKIENSWKLTVKGVLVSNLILSEFLL